VKEKELGLKFWAAVAISAVGMGVVLAFVAGFFLGHFTGHHHTTTVVAGQAASEETTTEEGEQVTAANGITLAPKFTSEELYEHAGDNWVSNGGGTTNDRYSSLDEINTENVT
jgi:glucose dehydrogenase